MRSVAISYLDGEIEINESEPSEMSEVLSLFSGTDEEKSQTAADKLTNHLRNASKYQRVYKAVSKALVEEGFAKEVKSETTLPDGSKKPIHISDIDHIRRFWAKDNQTGEENKETPAKIRLKEIFKTVADKEPLYTEADRQGVGRISAANLEVANTLMAKGEETVEKVVAAIEGKTGIKALRNSEGEITTESFARLLQAHNQHVQREAEKAAKAMLEGVLA